ncbi:MAG TPA: thiol:disulfide interchange protein DsbA/DsbL [Leucothrix sp.]|nr:thiol:disulfide interchange protein DsbA/DsbL [Leucothrix sp.]
MKNTLKNNSLILSTLVAISACDSASSDAKKVEINTVAPTAVVETAKAAPEISNNLVAKAETEATKAASVATAPVVASASKYIEGKHYIKISPAMQTDAPAGKVEVVEMMWLGCPHCYTLEPTMLKYKKSHPKYVDFKQVPAMLNPSWAKDGDTYYIAEMLDPQGEKDLITKVFQAIHEQKRRLNRPDAAKRFFVEQGYTAEQVDNIKNSMAFKAKIKRAQEISAGSQAQSVPTVIINGKYRTSPYIAGSEADLMAIIAMLAKKERK